MQEPSAPLKLLLLLWLLANPVLFVFVALPSSGSLANLLPGTVIELHEMLLSFFTAASVY